MIHVSLLSIEADLPWSLLAPQRSATQPKAPSPNPGRASSKEKSGPIFMDVSATTYALFHLNPLPLTPTTPWARNLSVDLSFVPETDEAPSSEDLSMLPLSTATLVRVPSDAGESTAMLHLHLLHTIESPGSSLGALGRETLGDVTRNYYELAVLAGATGRLAANPILPFHLAAVDAMHVALARGDSGADN
jgi:mediator of RNA polymerase II transcription subunit 13